MSIWKIVFIAIAIIGAAVNFTSERISSKTGISELKIKISALVVVAAAVILLFIFGK